MYQAIVFLPLLGSIVAAIIALAGAHARHPGGSPSEGGGHHSHDHAHAAVADGGHDAHHDDHHAQEPPAAGSRAAELVTTLFLFGAAVLSWMALWRVGFGHQDSREVLFAWIHSGDLKVDWSIRVDTLTVVMLVVVNTVSALVHIYSIGYMHHDPDRPRFFAYLSLFTFAMLALVTAADFMQLFFGWEGVGLASYLLIGFWFKKPTASAAAIKAFVVNRVGDFGFALGIMTVFWAFGTVEFAKLFPLIAKEFPDRFLKFDIGRDSPELITRHFPERVFDYSAYRVRNKTARQVA